MSFKISFGFIFLFFILFSSFSFAYLSDGETNLLTVSHLDSGDMVGGTAKLKLHIEPGYGRVFIETKPLTKVDTQISTRFANEIACDLLEDIDCSKYDFFYTIVAGSSVVGGPSAGSAITVLTMSMLNGVKPLKDVALTGTINSGGLIGSVAGVYYKIMAAKDIGIKKVIIPRWGFESNKSLSYINLSKEDNSSVEEDVNNSSKFYNKSYGVDDIDSIKGIDIVKVGSIVEVYKEFTGEDLDLPKYDFKLDDSYVKVMSLVSDKLCNRTLDLADSIGFYDLSFVSNMSKSELSLLNKTLFINDTYLKYNNSNFNFTYTHSQALSSYIDSMNALYSNNYYSRASFCYSANLNLRLIQLSNQSNDVLKSRVKYINNSLNDVEFYLNNYTLNTISDLETNIIVNQRILETRQYLDAINISDENISYGLVAYASERFYSVLVWQTFFQMESKSLKLDEFALKSACINKLNEADARYDYVNLYFPDLVLDAKKTLDYAYDDYNNFKYTLCIFKASKSKAEFDVLLQSIGMTESDLKVAFDEKSDAIVNILGRQVENNMFPIIGYSYYEYANSLKDSNLYSSLLYLEYALEMSRLDFYFPSKHTFSFSDIKLTNYEIFILGFILGILFTKLLYYVLNLNVINIKLFAVVNKKNFKSRFNKFKFKSSSNHDNLSSDDVDISEGGLYKLHDDLK